MVFSKILIAAVLGFTAADEVVSDATAAVSANSTENETQPEKLPELTSNDVKEFLATADEDKDNKTSLVEVNKLFSWDQSDEDLRKMFQGVDDEDMKLFLEQKNNMTSLFAEADLDKDGHLSEEEVLSNDGLKTFLQEELANNDDLKRGFDENGEFMEGDMKWGGDEKMDKMDDYGMGGGRGRGKRGKRGQFMDENMNDPSPRGGRRSKKAKSGRKAKKTQSA